MDENVVEELKRQLLEIANDDRAKFNALIEEISQSKNQISNTLNEAQEKLALMSSISESAKQKELELNTAQTRILELKIASEGDKGLMNSALSDVQGQKHQIDALLNEVKNLTEGVKTLSQKTSEEVSAISTFYTTFLSLKDAVENPDSGITFTLSKIVEVNNQIQKVHEEVSVAKEEVLSDKLKSMDIFSSSRTFNELINDELDKSRIIKEKIGKILDLVSDTGLANSFDKRRKRSQYALGLSVAVILVGVAVSAYLIHQIFLSDSGSKLFQGINNDYVKFLLRITLTAPGVFLAWFGASQYTKERFILEQYEFKTAAALALENYTTLLKQNYTGKDEQIFGLNLDMIRSVYKEPEMSKTKSAFSTKIKIPKVQTELETKVDSEEK